MIRIREDRDEKLSALTTRYRTGELTETVFLASLWVGNVNMDEARYMIAVHQAEHRNSLPYRRSSLL